MEKQTLLKKKSYPDGTVFISFLKVPDLHILLGDLMAELGLEHGDDIDVIFDRMENQYFHLYGRKHKAHIYVNHAEVSISFESEDDLDKRQLIKIIRKYFAY
jgi:hypothetical protein